MPYRRKLRVSEGGGIMGSMIPRRGGKAAIHRPPRPHLGRTLSLTKPQATSGGTLIDEAKVSEPSSWTRNRTGTTYRPTGSELSG